MGEWKRSAKGNLWQRLADGTTVTVFCLWVPELRGPAFNWCVADRYGPRFGEVLLASEQEAVEAAMAEVGRARQPAAA